ncbi:MAG: DegV family protein [Anaerolineaceae bacterium]|nr:DegV family protein [Anaerolineaceae bacterium]
MSKIAIITDSDSSLPADLAAQHGIRQVPITIHFENESYTTGVDIDDAGVFEIIDRLQKIPTTAAPPPAAFADAYQAAFDEGADAVVCICVSSVISSTYSAAKTACELLPGKEIEVIDSRNLTMGQGFMTLIAAEMAAQGASVAEISAAVKDAGSRMHTFGALSTLKYLAMSGRVGKLAAGMAATLNIKPILTVSDGKLDMLEKVRTQKRAFMRVLKLVTNTLGDKSVERMALVHVNNPEGAQTLKDMLCESLPCPDDVLTVGFTAGLSVHTGPGMVALVFLTEK